jgi:hypothetical protein
LNLGKQVFRNGINYLVIRTGVVILGDYGAAGVFEVEFRILIDEGLHPSSLYFYRYLQLDGRDGREAMYPYLGDNLQSRTDGAKSTKGSSQLAAALSWVKQWSRYVEVWMRKVPTQAKAILRN